MSYKAMDLVFEQHIADPQAKFVLIAIAKHADDNMQAFPSMNRLALLTGALSPSAINSPEGARQIA